jgi:hypothetical protein
MSQSKRSIPKSGPRSPSQTVTAQKPEPLIATGLLRGFASSVTPLYDPKDAPANWRKSARWVPWTKIPRTTYGRFRRTQRALLTPSGTISHSAGPSVWQSFDRACEIAKQLGFGPEDGGLAYILPQINDTAAPGALFFTLPAFTTAPGPFAALGSTAFAALGPFAASAVDALAAKVDEPVLPPQGTGEPSPPPQRPFEPAPPPEVPRAPDTAPLSLPADAIHGGAPIWPPNAALLDTLKQSAGWVYAYAPLLGCWTWLRVALDPDTKAPADRKPGSRP